MPEIYLNSTLATTKLLHNTDGAYQDRWTQAECCVQWSFWHRCRSHMRHNRDFAPVVKFWRGNNSTSRPFKCDETRSLLGWRDPLCAVRTAPDLIGCGDVCAHRVLAVSCWLSNQTCLRFVSCPPGNMCFSWTNAAEAGYLCFSAVIWNTIRTGWCA